MIRRPPRSTHRGTLFPYTTLFRSAVEKSIVLPPGATQEELQAYHYLLSKKNTEMTRRLQLMEEERQQLDERKRLADISSQRRAELSAIHGANSTGRTPHRSTHRAATRLTRVSDADRSEMTKNLESSFMSLDENGNVIPKTPTAAVLAVATYLQLTQPPEGDQIGRAHV